MSKKNYTSLIILFIMVPILGLTQDFYDIGTINTIEITFQETNWDQLLDQLYAAGDEERLTGMAFINGTQYDSIGVRYKGNSTYRADQVKNPLNIKLDYLIDDQKLEGYGTLKLANVYKDPSFVREVLGYEIARQYMPASKVNYIKVFINDTYLGLYTSVQDVDKFFMRTHFYSDENARIKGEISSSIGHPSGGVWEYYDDDSSSYYGSYSLESDFGWQDLICFLDTLNNYTEYVDQVLNIDRHLWFLAYSNLLVNLDGPINNPQNYYIYKDDAGRFNPIPWDLNESFGVFTNHQTLGQLRTSQLQQLSPFANLYESEFPVISKILSNDTYCKMYVAHMKTMIDENFSNQLYETRALEIQAIIDSDVQADPNKFYTYSDFINNVNYGVGGGGPPGPGNESIIGITELMDSRSSYLNALAEFQATAPTISSISHTPDEISAQNEVAISAEVENGSSVFLAWRNSSSAAFTKTAMADDGSGSDSQTGDGIYTVSVTAGASELQYYIYAENDEAAKFSPQRAAYECYTISVSAGDLVINEFMADNDAIVSDPAGEFDDWIELYNNSNNEISLNGYYLSDDGNDLTQWVFPDTSIGANSYLVIWADDDGDQLGLHANFKLSKSGEVLYLCNPDGSIVDEVTFEAQTTDMSSGRYPNGSGTFIEMIPSFGAENQNPTSLVENEVSALPGNFTLEQNFPNPFNPSTTIEFSLPATHHVSLNIYNVAGQLITTLLDEELSAGSHSVQWQPTNLSSGVYFYKLRSSTFSETRKMMIFK